MNGLRGRSGVWVRRAVAAVAVVAAAGTGGNGQATEPLSIARLYGAGVHAYFSGDYLRSYDDLTATIEAGSRDPRTRYFRGLAALSLGRFDEAEADFSQGAVLEADAAGDWPVSRSLERVQGHPRLQLERHRARSRVAALERANAMERDRYLQIQGAQQVVQRGRKPTGQPSISGERTNPFAADPDAGSIPEERPKAPEPMPAPAASAPGESAPAESAPAPALPAVEGEPAAGDLGLRPETESPTGESTEGSMEPPPQGSPVELPGDGAAAPGAAPVEEPAAETGTASETEEPATPTAGEEDPFGDNTPPPGAAVEPMTEEGAAPAGSGE